MKKIIVLMCLMSTCFFLKAQTYVNYKNLGGGNKVVNTNINNSKIKGSVYLFKKWDNNATISINNKEFIIKNINYDALKGKFISKISKDSIFHFYNLDKVLISGKTFIKINNNYYQSFDTSTSKNNFLKEYYIKEVKPQVHVITNLELKPAENKLMHKYFFYLNDNLIEVKLKKKDILNVFKLKKDKISNFVKINKLSYRKEKDVFKIYKFYESSLIN